MRTMTEHLVFAALMIPTVLLIVAAVLSLVQGEARSAPAQPAVSIVAQQQVEIPR
jgi:hypothetical protein